MRTRNAFYRGVVSRVPLAGRPALGPTDQCPPVASGRHWSARRKAAGLARATLLMIGLGVIAPAPAWAGDWPMFGRDPSRNMTADERGLPDSFDPGKPREGSEEIDFATTRNVRWVAKVGSQAYGNVTVAGGKIFVGTNNESPRDPKHQGDRGVMMVFDEKTGKFLWQLVVPKLGTGKVSDWEYLGICSSPTVVGNRVYLVTNRCEIVALTTEGLVGGKTPRFKDLGQYLAGPAKPPLQPGPTDADLIWRFDMREDLGVFPHNISSSSVLVVGGRCYAATSNGQDWTHVNIPNPKAPALACVDQQTGKYLGEEASGISARLFHSNWSTPSYGEVSGKGLVFFGGGDGILYAYDAAPPPAVDGQSILHEVWRFDCNPPEHKVKKDGKPFRYPAAGGPSEVLATPVFYKNRVYVAVGQDPEHGEGVGILHCVDATRTGDISKTGTVWSFKIGRSMSTVAIADGLLYIAEFHGEVHCLDAETGQAYWKHDTGAHVWGSTLVADGKIYVGNEDGDLTILQAGKELKVLSKINMGAPVYSTPVAANGTLFIGTETHLYAIGGPQQARSAAVEMRNAD